ncbi:MAG: thioesterase family protein [Chloroflexota bacterium]
MAEPLRLYETRIKPEWIDEFEHMNVAHYITVCDQATWAFWHFVNDDRQMEERDGHEYAIVESHVTYAREVALDEPVYVTTQLLGYDDKRFILFHKLWKAEDDTLSATNEVKGLGFNLNERRIESFLPEVQAKMSDILAEHETLGVPPQAGQGIALKKR